MRKRKYGSLLCLLATLAILSIFLPPIGLDAADYAPKTETLMEKGAEARAFVNGLSRQKRVRFEQAQKRSEARFEKKGWTKVDMFVVRTRKQVFKKPTSLFQQAQQLVSPTLSAQTFYYEDGYGVITVYDDNDDNTWEGNWFSHVDSTGDEVSLDLQFDISFPNEELDGDPPLYYAAGDLSPGDGEGGEGGGPIEMVNLVGVPGAKLTGARVSLASLDAAMHDECSCELLTHTNGDLAWCLAGESIKNAFWGMLSVFGAGALKSSCRATGPAYLDCVGVSAGAAAIGAVGYTAKEFADRCTR